MKIRIKGNTVRYRLSRLEVTTLAGTGRLEEKTEFLSDTLVYAVEASGKPDLSADFSHSVITLLVPTAELQRWARTEQVGLESNVLLPNGNNLHLLLEKDFKCIDAAVKEDQSDYFENPLLTC